jgi:hypothetical protein
MRRLCAVLAVALSASANAFASDIQILTDPEGAEVSQGSMHLGSTTKEGLRVLGVEPGMVTFTISKPGFETVTRVISVESSTEPMTILVRLQPTQTPGMAESAPTSPTPTASPAPSPVTPKDAAVPETAPAAKPKGGSNTALIILGGAAVVGGGVAALAGGHGSSTAAPTTTTTVPPTANLANLSATVTSPQQGAILNCNQEAFFTVSLTNTAHALVYITGVRLHQSYVDAACGALPDFTYQVTNSQIGTGTADVLNNQLLSRGGVGCCTPRPGCSGSCHVQFSFTVLTSVGEVTAGFLDYSIVFNGCSVCLSAAEFGAVSCSVKP